jgi:hypothetical protein
MNLFITSLLVVLYCAIDFYYTQEKDHDSTKEK